MAYQSMFCFGDSKLYGSMYYCVYCPNRQRCIDKINDDKREKENRKYTDKVVGMYG